MTKEEQIESCFWSVFDRAPTEEEVAIISSQTSNYAYFIAVLEEWGWNDTEVRDEIYVLCEKYKSSLDK